MNIKPLIPTYVNIARKNQVDDRTIVKEYFNKDKVRELEANYQEAIEYLKELTKKSMQYYNDIVYGLSDQEVEAKYQEEIAIIEKAYKKSWNEIKEQGEIIDIL